jgi:hypothetical protein
MALLISQLGGALAESSVRVFDRGSIVSGIKVVSRASFRSE